MTYVDYTKQSPSLLGTCVGGRGLERGLERAFLRLGWLAPKVITYVEIEAVLAWNLVKQMEQGVLDPAPVHTNVKTFPFPIFRGKIDFIIGGYPCQPFSVAGKQRGTEDPRHLWPYYKEGIRTSRPVCCFFENVRNHLNLGYEEVRRDLQELGYEVREGIYSAEEVGAPHKRDRLFILAIRRDALDNSNSSSAKSEIPTGRNTITRSGNFVDNSICPGLEGQSRDGSPERWKGQIGPVTPSSFPMGQGAYQYEWEEPRLESRLGFTVNGHNFTEDLLRMAGNGVVEQAAEVAFIDLINQF